jgi:small subunit ribosomal protein S16
VVRIRLKRVGSKKNPIWRIVVADRRSPRDGRNIETIGQYNAQTDPSTIEVDEERARYWRPTGSPACSGSRESTHTGADGAVQEMLLFMVRALVDESDAVRVDEIEEDGDLVFEVTVAEDDLGRVIGRGGRVAKSLRTLARAASHDDRRVLVDILD